MKHSSLFLRAVVLVIVLLSAGVHAQVSLSLGTPIATPVPGSSSTNARATDVLIRPDLTGFATRAELAAVPPFGTLATGILTLAASNNSTFSIQQFTVYFCAYGVPPYNPNGNDTSYCPSGSNFQYVSEYFIGPKEIDAGASF